MRMKKKKHGGLSLSEAAQELVKHAEKEADPFMRKLFLFTAAGVAAQAAVNESVTKHGKRRPK